MFDRDILSPIKLMIDQANNRDRSSKLSNVKGGGNQQKRSPKKSRDKVAPTYEEAINYQNVLPMKRFDSTDEDIIHPLTKSTEVRMDVTPDLLKKILKLTAKAKQIDPTQELALHGSLEGSVRNAVTSDKIKQIKSSCPSMKSIKLENMNLYAKQKSRRPRLVDFPANIERISLRNSTFEPKSFFANVTATKHCNVVEKLRVLDLGRAVFIGNNDVSADSWPVIKSLKELYLEGAPNMDNSEFLEGLLKNFPNLEVLDLEGTSLNEDDLVIIAKNAPNLRQLYLGFTHIQDASIYQMLNNGLTFPKLEVICLCETNVSDHGLDALVRSCQSLHSITVKRSKVTETAATAVKQILPGLEVHRVENTHIYAVFRDQGCEHCMKNHESESD